MKTSIAMATYNGEKFILEQLESFAKQTVLPNEVVIADDGSADNTLQLINAFKKTAPFAIRIYLNEKNLGYTQNFNKALQLCTNDLIFLSDQDDVWFPNKIEYMVSLANLHQSKDVFMTNAMLVDKDLETTGLTTLGQTKSLELAERTLVIGCCLAVRKTFLDMILPIPKDFKGHDGWIAILADFLNLRVIDDEVLQFYRRHSNNTSNGSFATLVVQRKYSPFAGIKKIIRLVKDSKKDILLNSIKQQKLLLRGSYSLNSHYKYQENEMNINIEDVEHQVEKLNKRLEILHTKKITSRFRKARYLYKNFGYSLKHFMSDLIFH